MFKEFQFESMYAYVSIEVYEAFAVHVNFIKFPHYKKIQSKSLRTYLYSATLDVKQDSIFRIQIFQRRIYQYLAVFFQLLRIQSINWSMQSLERLFGREITNFGEAAGQQRAYLRNKPNPRSLSFCAEQIRNIPRARQSIPHPNVSLKVQKPKFGQQQAQWKQGLTDYLDESLGFMLRQEQMGISSGWQQGDLKQSMRTILLDWIVDVHLKFKMFPQTLFIVTAIIDKFVALRSVKKEQLQLVGAAALLIAAKYQQTYQVPESSELVSLSGRAFTKNDLLKMQAQIVKSLEFNLIFNTSFHFFSPFCRLAQVDAKKQSLAQYTIQLALMDLRFNKYKPSMIAAASIFLINKIKRCEHIWPDVLLAASGYQEKELRACAKELCQILEQAQSLPHIKCLRRKFSLPKYFEVSKIRLEKKQKLRN